MAMKVTLQWKGKCPKHPRYRPEIAGEGGIKGGCARCQELLELWELVMAAKRIVRHLEGLPEEESAPTRLVDPNQLPTFP